MEAREHEANSIARRDFLVRSVATVGAAGAFGSGATIAAGVSPAAEAASSPAESSPAPAARGPSGREYNAAYTGANLNRVAFPLGGLGAGMVCLEGTGALSHVSLRNRPEIFHEPCTFAAVAIKGKPNRSRVLEGAVPAWKIFGSPGTGNGASGTSFGLPRYRSSEFLARFPFATVKLSDPVDSLPLEVEITGWSPFEPGNPDDSSLPAAALEYTFTNRSASKVEAVFSYHAKNFMAVGQNRQEVLAIPRGFVLRGHPGEGRPAEAGSFAARVDEPGTKVNCAWFRGGWWDALTLAWKDVEDAASYDRPPVTEGGPSSGATLFVPFECEPGASRTIRLQLTWFSGESTIRIGKDPQGAPPTPGTYRPWYAGRFAGIGEVADNFRDRYDDLRERSARFRDCFQDMTLPAEVIEAVAANLTILKSPTVLRQTDGRLWAWEGCGDNSGCCHGSCTHVWNYAQAIPHLFPTLERSLRETEFGPSQDDRGHQTFRSSLPIRVVAPDFHAATDGQLGGILKAYREWRIGGDTEWLRSLWPRVKASLEYCIETWDPARKGILEEPQHNTYDIEFWGPNGMLTSFYLAALKAMVLMGKALGEDVLGYEGILEKGIRLMETELYDGEYFIQKIQWTGLRAKSPLETQSFGGGYSPEAQALLQKEGPKYQYGKGCLADGVLGAWLALVSGVDDVLDRGKVKSHLLAVHRYNLKRDLSAHPNPQRPSFSLGAEGGLLICTWPKGGALSLPFVYSNEVWTGIEYQVASHLLLVGCVREGLEIVRVARDRYDGRIRNPFNEYECGHWYARAMSSYGLLQGLSGARYDAVEKRLYLAPSIAGDFRAFLSTATGYGTVGVKGGKPFLEVRSGAIEVKDIRYTPVA